PLGVLSGVVGQFFRALSLTLSVAVLISLVLALTLIPLLSTAAWRRSHGAPARSPVRAGASATGPWSRVLGAYTRSRAVPMKHPRITLAAAGVAAALTIVLFLRIPSGFLPAMDEGGFVIDYTTPAGTALEETDRLVRKMEAVVAATPEVASFSRRTGAEL